MTFRFATPVVSKAHLRAIVGRFDKLELGSATLLGAALFLWTLTLWTRLGGAVEGRLAAVIGITAGLMLAPLCHGAGRRTVAATAALWAVAQGLFCDFSASVIGLTSVAALESTFGRACIVIGSGVVSLAPGVALAKALSSGTKVNTSLGLICGVFVAWLLSIAVPLNALGLAVAAGFALVAIWSRGAIPSRRSTKLPFRVSDLSTLSLACASGMTVGVVARFASQWFLWTPATWAALLTAAAIATRFRVRWSAGVVLALASSLLLAGYGVAIAAGLQVVAHIHAVPLLVAAQFLLTVLVAVLPLVATVSVCRQRYQPLCLALVGLGVAIGATAAFSIPAILGLATTIGVVSTIPVASRTRLAFASAAIMSAVIGLGSGVYTPELLPRVLHSPSAIVMTQEGGTYEAIVAADEARLGTVADVVDGTLCAWNLRGFQVAFSDDGVTMGTLTQQTDFGPRLGPDVLATVIPMTLHRNPAQVTLVGVGNGESTLTATEFGVPTIQLVDDAHRIDFVEAHSGSRQTLWQDDRLTRTHLPIRWVAEAQSMPTDVLIVDPRGQSELTAAGTMTSQFVRGLHKHIDDDGVVCHRVRTGTVDADTLLRLAATYRAEFAQVHVFEIGVGQWVVVGTDRETPMMDLDFIERLQRLHVRRVLGQVGWDWTIVLNLHTLGPAELTEAIANAKVDPASIGSAFETRTQGLLAKSRAPEKFASFANLVSPYATRSVERIEDAGVRRAIDARLEDVGEKESLLAGSSDQFLQYRATLKDRLKTRPRSAIRQVGYEQKLKATLHPEDERRKAYLATLGESINSKDGRAVAGFAEPYDPLVSHFVHWEAAQIMQSAGDDEAALSQLMASVYMTYSDKSVANIVDALRLICDGYGGDDVARYDLTQGLLEQLRRRWHARIASGDPSLARGSDLGESVKQARHALEMLEELGASNPELAAHLQVREPVLRRDLIERLKMHQKASQQERLQLEQRRAYLKAERERESSEL